MRTVGAVLVVVVVVEYFLLPKLVTAAGELSLVTDVPIAIAVGAVALQAGSLAAYTCLTQRLLGGEGLPFGTQLRIDLTGYGFSHVLPGGGATAAAVRFRLMVARGVQEAPAASLAAVQTALAVVGLVAVWALGSLLSLPRTGSVPTALLLAVLVVLAAVGGQWLTHGGRVGVRTLRLADAALAAVPGRLRVAIASLLRSTVRTLRDTEAVRAGLGWSAANWLLDAGCLWLCLRGYGADVPPELVLVSYGLAMLVGLLPVTPGGVGVVEGLLVPGLVAAGAAAGPALLGVLTWRLLQFWLPIPIAAGCWLSLSGHRDSSGRSALGRGSSRSAADPGGSGTVAGAGTAQHGDITTS